MGRLDDKHAIVTGASRGIGEAIARLFVSEGARVLLAARSVADLERVSEELGDKAEYRRLDVTRPDEWQELSESLKDDPVDVLVNNAGGVLCRKRLHEFDLEEWRRDIEANLTSAFLGMKVFIPQMLERGGGSIVNIGSMSGVVGQHDAAAYAAAKGGLHTLSKNAAITYAEDGVRVNVVCPGGINVGAALEEEPEEVTRKFVEATPVKRFGEALDVAHLAVYLASDESAFVTGARFDVDGGYLAQ